ncbi:MAG: glycosyltransferase family 2 protein [Verrucomicrobiia bacterium]
MNILVLAAGGSEAFQAAGYAYPKNLVEVAGKPLLQHVMENVSTAQGRLIVVLRRDEAAKFHTDQVVRLLDPSAEVVLSPVPTSGAACTALLAAGFIDHEEPLLIANGDQLLRLDHQALVQAFQEKGWDGGIPVFEDVHPKYSYVKLGEDGLVVEAAEKRPISRLATAGRYYFSQGRTFVRAAQQMILKDAHLDGIFYVCPAYNEAVLAGARIGVLPVEKSAYQSLSTPQGVEAFAAPLASSARRS